MLCWDGRSLFRRRRGRSLGVEDAQLFLVHELVEGAQVLREDAIPFPQLLAQTAAEEVEYLGLPLRGGGVHGVEGGSQEDELFIDHRWMSEVALRAFHLRLHELVFHSADLLQKLGGGSVDRLELFSLAKAVVEAVQLSPQIADVIHSRVKRVQLFRDLRFEGELLFEVRLGCVQARVGLDFEVDFQYWPPALSTALDIVREAQKVPSADCR